MLVLLACASPLTDPTPYVEEARVLAVRAEPAEVEADATVRLVALYADATGELAEGDLAWSFCATPRPLAELGPIATGCLDPGSPELLPIGEGLIVDGVVPGDACSLFGPNPPPPREGEPSGRPADADVTGGYYQPALAFDGDAATLAPVRVRCGLANVAQETYVAWNLAYVSNVAPTATLDAPEAVAAGEAVTLAVAWDAAETYVVWDGEALIERREAISVTWFATGGEFAEARDGRDGDDDATDIENTWTAPEDAGEAWVWSVVRDERGGVGFTGARIAVD